MKVMLGDACEPWVLEGAELSDGRRRRRRDRRRRGQPRHVAAREAGVRRAARARAGEPSRATSGSSTSSGASTRPVSPPHMLTAMVEEAVTTGDLVRLLRLEGGRASIVEMKLDAGSPAAGQAALRAAAAAGFDDRGGPPRGPRRDPAARDRAGRGRRARRARGAGIRADAPRRRSSATDPAGQSPGSKRYPIPGSVMK